MAESPRLPAAEQPPHGSGYAPTAWGLGQHRLVTINSAEGPERVIREATARLPTALMARIAGVISGRPPHMGTAHPAVTGDTIIHQDAVHVEVQDGVVRVSHASHQYATGTGATTAPRPGRPPAHWPDLYAAGRP